jgi:Predicted AAA-ATPase/PD-(D/E)XK nuclease superfamily
MALKLPIGIQDFLELRTGNFVYIDKTKLIYPLVTGSKTYFFSRPRRFGKSLLVSTLRYLYEGRRDLFKGLWIEKHWDWDTKHPVIRLSLDAIGHKELGLKIALLKALEQIAIEFDIELKENEPATRFQELIRAVADKHGKVVVLIDEYDRPIIDFLGLKTLAQAEANRAILKSFFSILKSEDVNIRFLFLTGISKFSKVSIFSDLNHLYDLSSDPDSMTLCGYTQEEIDHYFAPLLAQMPPDTRDKMRDWYNGYSWNGQDFVYNPFSVLSFFKARNYQNFWFSTGTPTFLVERLNHDFQYALENMEVDIQALEAYELDTLNPIPLLFQTGYLTIKAQTAFDTVILDYPNREVRQSLVRFLLSDYTHQSSVLPRISQLVEAINHNDLAKTIEIFNGLFKAIPNQIFIANREAYFHSIVYLTFILMGVYIQSEVNSSDGRLDALVHTPERLFLFEFKLHEDAENALKQIKDKDYAAAFRHLNKPIIGVGIKFSESEKSIDSWTSAII